MISPSLGRSVRLLEDELVTALPRQIVADRKPGLSPTNDDGVDMCAHVLSPLAWSPARWPMAGKVARRHGKSHGKGVQGGRLWLALRVHGGWACYLRRAVEPGVQSPKQSLARV